MNPTKRLTIVQHKHTMWDVICKVHTYVYTPSTY